MLLLDYNTIIKHQYRDVDASRKKFHRLTWLNLFQFFKKKAVDQLNKSIKLKAELESSNNPQLKEADAVLTETIEHYYTSLRILKRHNKRESIPTSPITIDSCRHSLNTLQTVINGRRTT